MSTTPTPTPVVPKQSWFDKILMYIEIAAEVASAVPGPVGAGAMVAEKLISIAAAASNAHQALTGQPIDLTKLHNIDPVP